MADIGMFLGALVAVFVLAFLWEKILLQRILDDPVKGKVGSVIAAWLTASAVWWFSTAGQSAYSVRGLVAYAVAAALLGVLAFHRGARLREEIELGREAAE
ncbi:hypothetical protein E2493_20865 [Sphingomonas parva]|uniref:Uncharacterized protein n=1 Tax=Sphingomonas parva TaxID=2555898 RepID=A0A4Y8ZMC7_9SPHN|nr:hypothetical protein [Sphingomonas parva]TFI56305.1 hypothetical protein E2493_20865 [Sphingomonas parva]